MADLANMNIDSKHSSIQNNICDYAVGESLLETSYNRSTLTPNRKNCQFH